MLQKYLTKVKELTGKINIFEVRHVPREEKVRANILSKLASIKTGDSNKSLIQETLKTPSIADSAQISTLEDSPSWTVPIMQYLLDGIHLHDHVNTKR